MASPKVVLVTGSSVGGIGGSLVEEYAREGCIVYASARRLDSMSSLEPTGDIRKIRLDVNDDASVKEVVDHIIAEAGRIDILVNNAGVLQGGPVLDITMEELQATFMTNTFAIVRLAKAVVPHMAKNPLPSSGTNKTRGLVINIGSVTGIAPSPWAAAYCGSKAAVHSISDTMSMEFRPLGVKVMLLEPGAVKSRIVSNYVSTYSLPESSLYKPYIKRILDLIDISQLPGAMDTQVYAQGIVRITNLPPKNNPNGPWNPASYQSIGKYSWTYYMFQWIPRWLVLDLEWSAVGALAKDEPGL